MPSVKQHCGGVWKDTAVIGRKSYVTSGGGCSPGKFQILNWTTAEFHDCNILNLSNRSAYYAAVLSYTWYSTSTAPGHLNKSFWRKSDEPGVFLPLPPYSATVLRLDSGVCPPTLPCDFLERIFNSFNILQLLHFSSKWGQWQCYVWGMTGLKL